MGFPVSGQLSVVLLASAGLLACNPGANSDGTRSGGGGFVECVVPRPEICTRDYLPTCGLRDTGVRCVTEPCDSWETRTYGNACEACADPDVYGWRPDACEEEGLVPHD